MRLALFVLPLAGLLLSSSAALAQSQGAAPSGGKKGSNSQFLLRRGESGGASGIAARGRARAGDCPGALVLFDDALRSTVEPTLFRDRGLCHEKLEHRFPAIDDYRAYLVARPDAPDGDQIRERLVRLEGLGGGEAEAGPKSEPEKDKAGGSAEASASFSMGEGGASASASSKTGGKKKRGDVIGPSKDGDARGYDEYAADERKADEAESSALREGTGFIAGAFMHVPRYYFLGGSASDMAYSVDVTLRYAGSPSITLVSELGYSAIGTSGSVSALGGPMVLLGGELRIPISALAADQIVLGAGAAFEHYTVAGTRLDFDFWSLKARGGYRHVFGPRVGLEFLADGGPVFTSDRSGAVLGGSVALVVGF